MSQFRIGIKLASLGLPLRRGLPLAARLGAQGVELDARHEIPLKEVSQTALRQIRKMLDDLNLRVCAIGFATRRGYTDRENLEPRIAATKQAMKLAYELGANVVVNQIGRVPDSAEDPDWGLLLQVLTDLGRHGQHVGAFLAAETGSESPADLRRLIDALPPGSLAVNLDPGNLIVNGFSPAEAVAELGPHIMHIHAKDGVRDLAQGRGVEVPLGRGSADFPTLLGELAEHHYRGYVTVERENANDPVQEVGQAVEYLANI